MIHSVKKAKLGNYVGWGVGAYEKIGDNEFVINLNLFLYKIVLFKSQKCLLGKIEALLYMQIIFHRTS